MSVCRCIAMLVVPGQPKRYFALEISEDADQYRNQIRSLVAFENREDGRAFKDVTAAAKTNRGETHYTNLRFYASFEHARYVKDALYFCVDTFEDVWSFYEAIGYDYKAREYIA